MKLNKIFYLAKNLAKSGLRITRDNSIWNKTLECKFESSNNLPNHVGNCIIIKEKDNLVTVDRAAIELAITISKLDLPNTTHAGVELYKRRTNRFLSLPLFSFE